MTRRFMAVLSLAVALILGLWHEALAAVPHLIRYQGTLADTQQVPLEGPYTLTFRIYDAATGGTKRWDETQTNVPITKGQFSVLLGQVTPLDLPFDKDLWLSIQVNTDGEMTPRQRLSSVPYAYRAAVAEVAQTAQNMKTSAIEDDAHAHVPQGAVVLWTGASCPAGYAHLSQVDGKFLVGGVAYNPAAGGSNSHDHGGATGNHVLTIAEIPSHTHADNTPVAGGGSLFGHGDWSSQGDVPGSTGATGGGGGHTHTIAPADNRPEFATVLLCQKN